MKVLAGFAKLEPYIVPDSFSFSLEEKGPEATVTYEERGKLDKGTDVESLKSQFEELHSKLGLSVENVSHEVKGDEFSFVEKRTEKRETALVRIFNEILFQLKCHYSDSDIHRMVDSIVVSEVLDEGSPSSAGFPGCGSLSGIGFYVNSLPIDPSVVSRHDFVSFVEIPGRFPAMHGCSRNVLLNRSVEYGFTSIDPAFDEVPVPLLLEADHFNQIFMGKYNKNLLHSNKAIIRAFWQGGK